ncbi:MAG TPA: DUF4238 domain-containing protein [Patescibacteria group bacterium]|nr:DUF4238 domain-containing protein [Patescibacteria group bacterium]
MAEIQHYVPQFYLRYFALENDANAVWAYQRHIEPFKTNVKNIAGEKGFYRFIDSRTGKESDELEETYSKLEHQAQLIISKLNTPGLLELSREDRGNLAYFVTSLHVRGLSHRQMTANSMGEMQKVTSQFRATHKESFLEDMRKAGVERSEEEMEALRQFVLDGEYEVKFNPRDSFFLKAAMQMELDIYPVVVAKDIYLVEASQGYDFITSDNPVSVIPLKPPHPFYGGGGIGDGMVALPVSPRRALLLVNPNSITLGSVMNPDNVNIVNGSTYFHAYRFVFSNVKSIQTQKKFNSTKAGDGEKVVVSSPFSRK